MKYFLGLFSLIFILGCSSEGNDSVPKPEPDPNGVPIAVDDTANTTENDVVVIGDLLSNDTVLDNARITSFDITTTQGGTITDNRDNTYTYTPPANFVGEDTFTYTICDRDEKPDCSTATVTITVTDAGSPLAEDDTVKVLENSTKVLTILLDNDNLMDGAMLSEVDGTSSQGTVVRNADGTISYTAKSGFTGSDTFTYTICDNDTPNPSCDTATVHVTVVTGLSFNIAAEVSDYYSGVIFSEDADLMFEELEALTKNKHTTILSYGERHNYLYDADKDLNNDDNVILMYTGESRYWKEYTSGTNAYSPQTFNTEHIYPQSRLSANDAVTDLHHLRSCDANVNEERSNYPYVDGSGNNQKIGEVSWYPGDEWKGDVARMVMYLNIRYGETFVKVGTLELFLKWNVEDPVSDFEKQRNQVIFGAQGNRNPFIDNPYLATLIWGGNTAENTWK
ncbi:endonuclease [Tamlana fucoidanivorans]|uniref:Endonuclease I n=1 Tax=Allotamlana fucoidanivorans TaxID=2583814 RepID=A0A5C4SMZ4_9FLAO|nr:endonuclease [Tamlana fucoidanivorans]TNJ45365.1 endonuclease I [Tamlana fucoidanivorans]